MADKASTPLDDYVTREDWAEARGVSVRTIKRDETHRRGPKPIRIGNRVFYAKKDIADWLQTLHAGSPE